MKIRIDDIGEKGLHIKTKRKPAWVTNIPEFSEENSSLRLVSDVFLDFTVTKIVKEITVKGILSYEILSPCARCLDMVKKKLAPELNLLLSPGKAEQDYEDELDYESYDENSLYIDLSSYIMEKIAIAIPFKIICKEDCKGLCQMCGTNLNYQTCTCNARWVDPRMAKLKNIKL